MGEASEERGRPSALHRAMIADVIRRSPGIHLRELQRRTSLSWSTVMHHTRALERASTVRVVRGTRYARLYPLGPTLGETAGGALAGRATEIVALLPGRVGISSAEIQVRLRISAQLASYHLRRLVRSGQVVKVDGRPSMYLRA